MSNNNYHIDIHGNAVVCHATIQCTKKDTDGNTAPHFNGNPKEANKWAEEQVAKEHGGNFPQNRRTTGTVSNNVGYRYSSINDKYSLPQANDLEKISTIVDAVSQGVGNGNSLGEAIRSRTEEEKNIGRQGEYYASAAGYLGLIDRNHGGDYSLTRLGEEFVESTDDERIEILRETISHIPAMQVYRSQGKEAAVEHTASENPNLDIETARRRVSSLVSWDKKLKDENFSEVVSEEKNSSKENIQKAIEIDTERREQKKRDEEEKQRKEGEKFGAQKANEFICVECGMIRANHLDTGGNICVECE